MSILYVLRLQIRGIDFNNSNTDQYVNVGPNVIKYLKFRYDYASGVTILHNSDFEKEAGIVIVAQGKNLRHGKAYIFISFEWTENPATLISEHCYLRIENRLFFYT